MAGFSAERSGRLLAGRFRSYLADVRTYVALAYAMVMAVVTTVLFQKQAASYAQVFNVFEPFVYFFSEPARIIMPLAGVFIALCDVAQLSPDATFMLLRCRRSEWWVAELLFSVIVTVCFYVVLLLLTVLLFIPNAYAKDTWSVFASTAAYAGNARISEIANMYSTPAIAAVLTLVLQTLHALTLAQIMMTANIVSSKNKGVVLAVAYEVFSYCLNMFGPPALAPVSVFGRAMLAWNGMNAPRLWQTAAFYLLLLAACMVVQRRWLKRYNFVTRKAE